MFKLLRDDKGQMMPFIAFMMVIILLFASFTISTTMMFLERKKIEDAPDAAVISAILADAKEKRVATHYSDGLRKVCTDGYWATGSYTDADGNSHTYSYWVCTDWYWSFLFALIIITVIFLLSVETFASGVRITSERAVSGSWEMSHTGSHRVWERTGEIVGYSLTFKNTSSNSYYNDIYV